MRIAPAWRMLARRRAPGRPRALSRSQRQRVEGRQAPILALRAERVGRRADRERRRRSARAAPRPRSRRGRRRPRGRGRGRSPCRRARAARRGCRELAIGEPLQPGVEARRAPRGRPRKRRTASVTGAGGILRPVAEPGGGPARGNAPTAPRRWRAPRSASPPSRRNASKPGSVPACAPECRPRAPAAPATAPPRRPGDRRGRRPAGPRPSRAARTRMRLGARAGKARERVGLDEQGLEEEPRGGRVGRDLGAVALEQGVDRAEAQERGAAQARIGGGPAGIRVGADAEIAGRAQAVELRREAPVAGTLVGVGAGAPAALGRGDHPGFGPAPRRG